jgi:hypothetical protein
MRQHAHAYSPPDRSLPAGFVPRPGAASRTDGLTLQSVGVNLVGIPSADFTIGRVESGEIRSVATVHVVFPIDARSMLQNFSWAGTEGIVSTVSHIGSDYLAHLLSVGAPAAVEPDQTLHLPTEFVRDWLEAAASAPHRDHYRVAAASAD